MNQLTKKQEEIYNWLLSRPGYLKKSALVLNKDEVTWTYKDTAIALKQARKDHKKPSLEEYHDAPIKLNSFKDTVWGKKMVEAYKKLF